MTYPAPFLPAWLDDAGLTPVQFRVYCHLWRRDLCHSSADTIAKICRINRKSVFAALKELESAGLICREARAGQTTIIRPVAPNGTGSPVFNSEQFPADPWPETGQGVVPDLGQVPVNPWSETEREPVSEMERVPVNPVSEMERGVVSQTERHPSQSEPHKGNPIKVIPLRERERALSLDQIDSDRTLESGRVFDRLKARINQVHPDWESKPHFTHAEERDLSGNQRFFEDLAEDDWELFVAYYDARIDPTLGAFWRPDTRSRFVEKIADIYSNAKRWRRALKPA